jgi:hypothetical protein
VFVLGDWLSDLDPRVALGAVILALFSGVAKAFGEVLLGELKLWLKEKVRRRRKRADLTSVREPQL